MKKIIKIIAFIIIITLIGVFIGYIIDNDGHLNENDAKLFGIEYENRTEITLYSDRPINLNILLHELRNEKNSYEYNNDTLLWMQSLKEREVFVSNNSYILMNKIDAEKIKRT